MKNIVFNAHLGDLICVIGPVGSGKVRSFSVNKILYYRNMFRVLFFKHWPVKYLGLKAKFDCMEHSVMFHKNHVRSFTLIIIRCIYIIVLGIFSSSIKENILFGKEYHHKLFQRVINATALETVGYSKYSRQIVFYYHSPYRILFNYLMVPTLLLVIKVWCYLE